MALRYPCGGPDETGAAGRNPRDIIGRVRFLRMKPGHGEVLLAEGDPRVREDEERLVEEFRRQLDEGMWAAVPVRNPEADAARRRWSGSTETSRRTRSA